MEFSPQSFRIPQQHPSQILPNVHLQQPTLDAESSVNWNFGNSSIHPQQTLLHGNDIRDYNFVATGQPLNNSDPFIIYRRYPFPMGSQQAPVQGMPYIAEVGSFSVQYPQIPAPGACRQHSHNAATPYQRSANGYNGFCNTDSEQFAHVRNAVQSANRVMADGALNAHPSMIYQGSVANPNVPENIGFNINPEPSFLHSNYCRNIALNAPIMNLPQIPMPLSHYTPANRMENRQQNVPGYYTSANYMENGQQNPSGYYSSTNSMEYEPQNYSTTENRLNNRDSVVNISNMFDQIPFQHSPISQNRLNSNTNITEGDSNDSPVDLTRQRLSINCFEEENTPTEMEDGNGLPTFSSDELKRIMIDDNQSMQNLLCLFRPSDFPKCDSPIHPLVRAEYDADEQSDPEKQRIMQSTEARKKFFLTEVKLSRILKMCEEDGSHRILSRCLRDVFSNYENICRSFHKVNYEPPDVPNSSYKTVIDIPSLKRSVELLNGALSCGCENDLGDALNIMIDGLCYTLKLHNWLYKTDLAHAHIEKFVNTFVVLFEMPLTCMREYDVVVMGLSRACGTLPSQSQARLCRIWARYKKDGLYDLLRTVQHLITIQVIKYDNGNDLYGNQSLIGMVKFVKLIYYSSIMAGEMAPTEYAEDNHYLHNINRLYRTPLMMVFNKDFPYEENLYKDPLAEMLELEVIDSIKPIIDTEKFYNKSLSNCLHLERDLKNLRKIYDKNNTNNTTEMFDMEFSFLYNSFMITPAVKSKALQIEHQRLMTIAGSNLPNEMDVFDDDSNDVPAGTPVLIRVRREFILEDALQNLESISRRKPEDLKRRLVVQFVGEQGRDEGGISREFFYLILKSIFNPCYGLFIKNPETGNSWFTSVKLEDNDVIFLIGILIGMTVYHGILSHIPLPSFTYKKLLGRRATFHDLKDLHPSLYRGLNELLEYEGDDVEDTFMQTFRVTYTDLFNVVHYHDLVANGDNVIVSKSNRKKFVYLYADFLLNKSVQQSFDIFRRGFQILFQQTPVTSLLSPNELETIICGSPRFDLHELERVASYIGYDKNDAVIRNFWEYAHSLPISGQRKLLRFITSSDLAPIGGLRHIEITINRNGLDSSRLPVSHTCFNSLLLPEYSTKEKLVKKMNEALNYASGFHLV